MVKIVSGQAYLYRDGGLDSTVIDVRMKHKIRGDFLQRALTRALERYPYLANKFVEKNGDFYTEQDFVSMIVTKTNKFRVLGSMSTGYHLVDVTFTENQIRVAFHHGLCDGRGIKPFVETLIYYYCCLRYNKKLDATGIRLAGEPLLPGETQEPFGNQKYEFDEKNLPQVEKDGYMLPENSEEGENYYRCEITFDQQQFMKYARSHNATPSILIALLASGTIHKLHPDGDKPVICSMATDYRRELGVNNTHKNCVGSIYLPYSEETQRQSLSEQATLYRDIMKKQKSPDAVKYGATCQIGLFEKLNQLGSLEEKKQMMSFFNNICINTYVISYIGQMELGGCAEYVESMHLYSSGTKGLRLTMISAGNSITVNVQQSFETDEFLNAFLKVLDETGVAYTATERIKFETTKDKTFVTAGRQAEKFFRKITKS